MSKTSIDWLPAFALNDCRTHGDTMGTRYTARFLGPRGIDARAIAAALAHAVATVDAQMSNWKADSDLTRVNRSPPGAWITVPHALALVLQRAVQIGRETGNAFNAAVGDLVQAWGFGPGAPQAAAGREGPHQPLAPLDQCLEIDLERARVRKHGRVALDLCGMAKGYGVDELARVLDGQGIGAWIVGIDGELRVRGHRPDGSAWAIALESPREDMRQALGVIELCDAAVASSGDYRHWAWVDGRRVSHTMDPRTGAPAWHAPASVTVISEQCMDADAYASALMVLGEEAGHAQALRLGLDALFVLRDQGTFRLRGTGSFAQLADA